MYLTLVEKELTKGEYVERQDKCLQHLADDHQYDRIYYFSPALYPHSVLYIWHCLYQPDFTELTLGLNGRGLRETKWEGRRQEKGGEAF